MRAQPLGPRARRLALALPFVIGAVVLRMAIAPAGDAIAKSIAYAVPPPSGAGGAGAASAPAATDEPASPDVAPPAISDEAVSRRIASRTPSPHRETPDTSAVQAKDAGGGGGGRPSLDDAPKATIVVPASVVTRALERRDVGATNAKTPDGAPLGARLVGVGKYRTGLRDGDVVVNVAGTRTPTTSAMVGAAMQAASSGATRISGRIVRGDATFAVVLELPK
ncbi:MAG: hypothetical protein JWP87_3035 [Labilithrix sp.]|nr:hypothetical protein [Labilithrix sp.]